MNAYMHYASHQRPILKAKSPTMKPTEMTTALGEQWKSLSEADKKVSNRFGFRPFPLPYSIHQCFGLTF